ncbi:FolC bifunctional protein [Solidesulfovibrio fructosivorans JJ]]|uniref:Dihydrofolate synthase/folylpolyglutamate synthase n=1 Tax=Solidesulfovibrio fructosivorans JJ] TaxID=596151 RepID=E1JY29_SOLFR|nr:bifunctional folylpolyglutamate synthase/dihydrofolate synthase [Solidesulfovibrio fructosivorans]EFL50767.1 FolC bifunctional protein [Solidesulfovibrio fructosivorans JJ]]
MIASPSEFTDFAAFAAYLDSLGLFHMELGPHRMQAALAGMRLSTLPHLAVQVVGTNGKGSTGAFLAAMLAAHGLPTGLYLSPHFVDVRERILMNGRMLDQTDWVAAANAVMAATRGGGKKGKLTYFELLTAMAVRLFTDQGAEAAVYEAGLGGAGDATTALGRDLVLFTPIGLDHAAVIGPTLADIARDKAGAMVPGGVAVTGPQPTEVMRILRQEADARGTRLHLAGELAAHDAKTRHAALFGNPRLDIPAARLRLAGPHQSDNAALALAGFSICARKLGIEPNPEALSRALTETFLPGRLHLLKLPDMTPGLLLDCAHNPPAMAALAEALGSLRIAPAALVFTCLGDKDLAAIAPLASKLTAGPIYVPELPGVSRARPAAEVAAALGERAVTVADPAAALDAVRRLDGTVVVCGSMYLLAALFAAPQN